MLSNIFSLMPKKNLHKSIFKQQQAENLRKLIKEIAQH